MRQRLIPNPLAAQLEERHGALLDELHRLSLLVDSEQCCVCGPCGYEGGGGAEPLRQATDDECRFGELNIGARLFFDLTAAEPAVEAARQIGELIRNLEVVQVSIARFGETLAGKRRNGKRGAA